MTTVLSSRDLVGLITSFQDGLPQPLLATHVHLRQINQLVRIGAIWLGCRAACLRAAPPLDVWALQQLHRRRPTAVSMNVMDYVAATGQFRALLFLHVSGSTCSVWAMNAAAEHGHIAIVRFLHDHRREGCTVYAMDAAAKHGHLDVLEFLHYHRHEGCTSLALNAGRHGRLGIVQLLHAKRPEGCSDRAIEDAAMHGHLDVVRFLDRHRREGSRSRALRNAAANGHRAIVAYLLPLVDAVPPDAMDFAARNGEIETLRRALTWAAMAGHVHVVAFLRQNRSEGDANEALVMALRMGMNRVAVMLQRASVATSPVVDADIDYLGFSMSKKRAPSCLQTF
ncbi:hypothetical protein SPRG_13317 [Saprolegnia parasitica CBS 223.65]|uniref:Uncharacterized protein n=1 Tax=Saprolegnia parasitica (strain CBS 223.65) TaxID=695850 RepID=A0A067BV84_SAPPC|nr:hypothetical protein SPRG_13317 [Saprolegnia parasitica CBS 223.65]KDO20735.1 hypothetical protein SPRG_13317 [Saprolegnia parasitica CBS 223.65]|eukprot:XP_012208547.1 hypothetical protein SPRG_13317 [Saprolegnia parasitica CBS 223.65]